MFYRSKERLTLITLMEERSYVSFDELAIVLDEKPNNIIYVEMKGFLYGIISSGDIKRATEKGLNNVSINRMYTYLSCDKAIWASARRIFDEKKAIHGIPVIDNNNQLIGEYTRWVKINDIEKIFTILNRDYLNWFVENVYRDIVLVQPVHYVSRKEEFIYIEKVFIENNIPITTISSRELIKYGLEKNTILFTDEEEMLGTLSICRLLNRKQYDSVLTISMFMQSLIKFGVDYETNRVMSILQEKGINVLAFDVEENTSGYLKFFNESIPYKTEYLFNNKKMTSSLKKGFFNEIYDERYEMEDWPLTTFYDNKEGLNIACDVEKELCHITNGKRYTASQPKEYEHSVYVYGPCSTAGLFAEDKHTVASFLQEKFNTTEKSLIVHNDIVIGWKSQLLAKIMATPLKAGDLVVIDKMGMNLPDVSGINLTDLIEKSQIPLENFVDEMRHYNYRVAAILASEIYEKCNKFFQQEKIDSTIVDMEDYIQAGYLSQYFHCFNSTNLSRIGAIVMNCNPFTLGHRYLIEKASVMVDYLIVFLVEEDTSFFSFDERYSMVLEGVRDIKNIMVVPSGDFIISKATFPEYFVKENSAECKRNAENDVRIFGKKIAPMLNITYRFVGEEPNDVVTAGYNNAMKEILPHYGIQVVEISRKRDRNEKVISATTVRECLMNGDIDKLKEYVPDTTFQYLVQGESIFSRYR